MMRLQGRVALLGYSMDSKDYSTEYRKVDLSVLAPRHIRCESYEQESPRIGETEMRRLAKDVQRRIIAGSKRLLTLVGTVNVSGRNERSVEIWDLSLSTSVDLSLLNVFSLGITTDIITANVEEVILNGDSLYVISAVTSLESGPVYVSETSINDPKRHYGLLKYIPSYVFKHTSLDTYGLMDTEASVYVLIGERPRELNVYARYLERYVYPEQLRDFVDAMLFRLKPSRNRLKQLIFGSTVYFVAKYISWKEALKNVNKDVAIGLGMLARALEYTEIASAAKLAIEAGFIDEFLEGSDYYDYAISKVIDVAHGFLEEGNVKEAFRIVDKVFKVDQELSVIFLHDVLDRHPELASEIKKTLLRRIPSLDPKSLSIPALEYFLDLIRRLKIAKHRIAGYAKDILLKALDVYEKYYRTSSPRKYPNKPEIQTLLALMFALLPPPEELAKDKRVRKLMREILEQLRYDLSYSRYDLKRTFEGLRKGSYIPPLLMAPSDDVAEYLLELLKRIASDDYVLDYPIPRKERIEAFAPEMMSEFDEIRKNFESLRKEISAYLEKREAEGPSEGEGDEEV